MTRKLTALVFLGRLAATQPQPAQAGGPNPAPQFSKADMDRLLVDINKVTAINTNAASQILAKKLSSDLEKAAKVPPAQRAAAMRKAQEDYRKRVDAVNQDGLARVNWQEGTSPIINPPHPEFGYWKNLLDACTGGRRFATRTEDGTPVFRQVTTEGGTRIHTFTVGVPIEETEPSPLSASALCPTLVRNAAKASPPGIAEAASPSGLPKAMQICASACATLEWTGSRYEVMGRDGKPATAYAVESFTPSSLILRRAELPHSGDYGLTAVYHGTFQEGGTTAQGTVDFGPWPGHSGFPHSGTWKATWGASLAAAAQRRPEERGEAEEAQAKLAAQQREIRDKLAGMLMLGLLFGAMDGDSSSGSGSGACTAGHWQFAAGQPNGGTGQMWVCDARGQ